MQRILRVAVGPAFVALAFALLIALPRGMGTIETVDIFVVLWVVFALIVSWRARYD